jgi:colanic acid/amylovoran biosynthesis glycosyltransferase
MGVRIEEFPFRTCHLNRGEPVRVLTVGRLIEKKGLEYALRAMRLVIEREMNVCYEIIGDGPLKPTLERHIDELNLASIVTLWGARDIDFVRQRIADSHLFLLPSVTAADGDEEGVPVSLMEAQASGLPVLSTRHSGIPELVADGESGILVPERDAEALAAALVRLIENPEPWDRMGREGRKIVERRFNSTTLARDLVQLYDNMRLSFHHQPAAICAL